MKNSALFENIQCVTLDLDDTLWPVEPTISHAEQALYSWIDLHYPRITQRYTLQDLSAQRATLARQCPDIAHNVTELRYRALTLLAQEFNYQHELARDGMAFFRHHRNQVTPYQYSEPVLEKLKQHFIVGAITNGNAQLDKIPIGRHFDFAITAEQAGCSKPDPEMFLKASQSAGISVDKLVHVGDSPRTDVLGAMNAGCKAIWFNDKRHAWPGGQTPHCVVHCLSDLPGVLMVNKRSQVA